MKFLATIAILASAALTTPAMAQEWNAEQAEVWTHVSGAWEDNVEGSTWHTVLDPNGYGWNTDYPVPASRDQMASRTSVFGAEGEILFYQLDPVKISVNGDTAIAFYFANIVENNHKGERETSVERCADTLVKRDGKWHFLGWLCETKSSSDKD